jgi:hypothetical protein
MIITSNRDLHQVYFTPETENEYVWLHNRVPQQYGKDCWNGTTFVVARGLEADALISECNDYWDLEVQDWRID